MLELRSATDLVRLRLDGQPPKDIQTMLKPILAAIEDGEDLRDVREARGLLEELVPPEKK